MIHSIAWFCPEHYGVFSPAGTSYARSIPAANMNDELIAVIGRPVKYFSRMNAETKSCLCAASLAMRAMQTSWPEAAEIGLMSAGNDGCVSANQDYFRDYVASGRSMGRGNLFIYTLPTSTLGEVAIALSLTGPSMYVHADKAPLASLVRQANQLIADCEADSILALWSDAHASVCFAITAESATNPLADEWVQKDLTPFMLAHQLHAKVNPA